MIPEKIGEYIFEPFLISLFKEYDEQGVFSKKCIYFYMILLLTISYPTTSLNNDNLPKMNALL